MSGMGDSSSSIEHEDKPEDKKLASRPTSRRSSFNVVDSTQRLGEELRQQRYVGSSGATGDKRDLNITPVGPEVIQGEKPESIHTVSSDAESLGAAGNEKGLEIKQMRPEGSQGKRPESTQPENLFTVEAILAREEPLTLDELKVQKDVYRDYELKKGKEKSSEEVQSKRPEVQKQQDEQIVKEIRKDYKKRSVAEILDYINEDRNKGALEALTNHTVDKIEKALIIPEDQKEDYRAEVREIYREKGLKAKTLYNYIEFLQLKGKMSWWKLREESKQPWYFIGKDKHTERRYEKKLPKELDDEKLDAYEARRDRLVERHHGHLKLEGNNKHGREKSRLDRAIELKREYKRVSAEILAAERIIREIRQLRLELFEKAHEYEISGNVEGMYIVKYTSKRLKNDLKSFKGQIQLDRLKLEKVDLQQKMDDFESLIVKHGSHPWSARANNWASGLGFIFGAPGLALGIAGATGAFG